jgi:hypothetical protein
MYIKQNYADMPKINILIDFISKAADKQTNVFDV